MGSIVYGLNIAATAGASIVSMDYQTAHTGSCDEVHRLANEGGREIDAMFDDAFASKPAPTGQCESWETHPPLVRFDDE